MPIQRFVVAMFALLQTSIALSQSGFVERKLISTDAARKIVDACVALSLIHI